MLTTNEQAPIVYAIFPNIGAITGDRFLVYDSIRSLRTQPLVHEALQHAKPSTALPHTDLGLPWSSFWEHLGVSSIEDPVDSEKRALIQYYILARSGVVVYHLDVDITAPEVQLASFMRIPIIGVTKRFLIPPTLHALLQVVVQPHQATINEVMDAVLRVNYRQDSEETR